ncbi:hypothetical protein [Nocardia seriolae]|uniref:Uncharacterized protein n=1 Tax=Nocardia seriolae TaxID=37332 RepID=A0ABC9YKU9_9NOCA|nr:hypothetical protein [Nocardia seriolae]MTJ61184.1 hypothetical protein [Nocardia seriolae]MTJ69941.1 hypothetical protein [Nocardia seriolae]MTJ90691.1 hypothetical protein [Nocardia seriolae]MTK34650.1 hypothetical protein [Nocardia seriolae]MTK39162.1 hypothetical protein [Nocardia seriolae]
MADRAAAASFTAWRVQDPEPTVTEASFSETPREGGPRDTDNDKMNTGTDAMMGDLAALDCADESASEYALVGLFDALGAMLRAVPASTGRAT